MKEMKFNEARVDHLFKMKMLYFNRMCTYITPLLTSAMSVFVLGSVRIGRAQ